MNGTSGALHDPLSRWLAILAVCISAATLIYTVFVKPRIDLRHGGLSRRIARHEEAIFSLKRIWIESMQEGPWALQQVFLNDQPHGNKSAWDLIAASEKLSNDLKYAAVGLMSRELVDAIDRYSNALSNSLSLMKKVASSQVLEVWERDTLSGWLNRDVSEAYYDIQRGIEDGRPDKKPPFLRVRVEMPRRKHKDIDGVNGRSLC